MIRFAFIFALLPLLAFSCTDVDKCNCEPNCWEKCFNNLNRSPTSEYGQAYIAIYKMAMGIRSLYAPCFKPHGTAYAIDATVPPQSSTSETTALYQYQRHLASIVAMVQPVNEECNPMCASKFYNGFAYYVWSWNNPCKDRCQAAQLFQSSSFASYSRSASPSWPRGGSILANHCFNNRAFTCMNCTRDELVIAFTNSEVITADSYCDTQFRCAIVGTNPAANFPNMQEWADPGLVSLLPYNVYFARAARAIHGCLSTSCCSRQSVRPPIFQQPSGKRGPTTTTADSEPAGFYTSSSSNGRVSSARTEADINRLLDKYNQNQ